jgi:hypothetical protein
MRILLVVPMLLMWACNGSTVKNAVTVQYDQNTAENAAADVGNTAANIGGAIANEADETAAKVNNSSIVADHDQNKADSNTTENKQ